MFWLPEMRCTFKHSLWFVRLTWGSTLVYYSHPFALQRVSPRVGDCITIRLYYWRQFHLKWQCFDCPQVAAFSMITSPWTNLSSLQSSKSLPLSQKLPMEILLTVKRQKHSVLKKPHFSPFSQFPNEKKMLETGRTQLDQQYTFLKPLNQTKVVQLYGNCSVSQASIWRNHLFIVNLKGWFLFRWPNGVKDYVVRQNPCHLTGLDALFVAPGKLR